MNLYRQRRARASLRLRGSCGIWRCRCHAGLAGPASAEFHRPELRARVVCQGWHTTFSALTIAQYGLAPPTPSCVPSSYRVWGGWHATPFPASGLPNRHALQALSPVRGMARRDNFSLAPCRFSPSRPARTWRPQPRPPDVPFFSAWPSSSRGRRRTPSLQQTGAGIASLEWLVEGGADEERHEP